MEQSPSVAVTNTSPIIALAAVDQLVLLEGLFARVVVPREVWTELTDKEGAPEPDRLLALSNVTFAASLPPPTEAISLHPGEHQAIAVAIARRDAMVLLDEGRARKVAANLGLVVRGTLGILVEAQRRRLLPVIRPLLLRLREADFRMDERLVRRVLTTVGEMPRE